MAAGLGFKDFTTGEVLTAADVDGYLMQGIWVFTNATARDAAVTSPQEGNFAFTKDNNSLWYYDGAAWVASGATGDIEGVTAGIGISGGGTSGTVTVTNSMATAIDAKGDLVVGTGADTFSKLTVGANGTTLVADSAEATGLKWATPSAGSTFNGCRVWASTTQTLANATGTVITWNSESYDTNSYHSTVTNTSRLTVPSTGYYLLNTTIIYDDNTNGARLAYIRKNGTSEVAYTEIGSDGTVTNTVNAQIYAAANDYFEVIGYQNSGGNLQTLYAGEQYNFFSAVYLGA